MYVTKYVDNTKYAQSSVMSLASYLEKEGLIQGEINPSAQQLSVYLDKQNDVVRVDGQEYFFNETGSTYDSENITKAIDRNVKGLKKTEARYYSFAISPSSQEITHLRRTIADTKSALCDAGEIVPDSYEDDMIRSYLKQYGVKCMDAYAQNFGHPNVSNNKDLLWFGMIEKERYWKSSDKEVRYNANINRQIQKLHKQLYRPGISDSEIYKRIGALDKKYIRECDIRHGGSKEILRPMMVKSGDNWHIHVVVSRRDITNSFNLSPNANSRGSQNHALNGKAVRVGFNRESFKISCESIFDKTFLHERLLSESYEKAKELRNISSYAFETQRIRDLATRKSEGKEYVQMKALGYNEYYENLIEAERLDSKSLFKLKRHIVNQVQKLDPKVKPDELMKCSIEELQLHFGQLEFDQGISLNRIDNIAARAGDKLLQANGLPVYTPLTTMRKVLRRGIAMSKTIDMRRQTYDSWFERYSDSWYKENYIFDSIAQRRNTECFLAQAEALETRFGAPVLLRNAQDYQMKLECQLVTEYLKENWQQRAQDVIQQHAVEIFGQEGETARNLADFNSMAQERLLPVNAAQAMQDAAKVCDQPRTFAALREQISHMSVNNASFLTAKLELFEAEQGQTLDAIRSILIDNNLPAAAKEEALMALACDDKALDKALRDLRTGMVKVLEQQQPEMAHAALKKTLDERVRISFSAPKEV